MIPAYGTKEKRKDMSSATAPHPKAARASSIFDNPRNVEKKDLAKLAKRSLEQLMHSPFPATDEETYNRIREAVRTWKEMAVDVDPLNKLEDKTRRKIFKACNDILVYSEKFRGDTRFTIRFGNKSISLNTYYLQLLRANSAVIDTMLERQMKEAKEQEIDFSQNIFDEHTFRLILNLLENEAFPIPPDQALRLLGACNTLQINVLTEIAYRRLLSAIAESIYDFDSLITINRFISQSLTNSCKITLIKEEIALQLIELLMKESFQVDVSEHTILGRESVEFPLKEEEIELAKAFKENNREKFTSLLDKINPAFSIYLKSKLLQEEGKLIEALDLYKGLGLVGRENIPLTILADARQLVLRFFESYRHSLDPLPGDYSEAIFENPKLKCLIGNLAFCFDRPCEINPSFQNIIAKVQFLNDSFNRFSLFSYQIMKDLDRLVELNPDDLNLRRLRVELIMALLKDVYIGTQIEWISNALEDLKNLIANDKSNPRLYLMRGTLLVELHGIENITELPDNVPNIGIEIPSEIGASFKKGIQLTSENRKQAVIDYVNAFLITAFKQHNAGDSWEIEDYCDDELIALTGIDPENYDFLGN